MSERKPKQKPKNSASGNSKPEARPRNWLVPVMLLSLREWNSYGYELMEQVAAFGFEAMNSGAVYRTLRHMEKDGTVKSRWDTSGTAGPARRIYTITDAGEPTLPSGPSLLSSTSRRWTPSFGSTGAASAG